MRHFYLENITRLLLGCHFHLEIASAISLPFQTTLGSLHRTVYTVQPYLRVLLSSGKRLLMLWVVLCALKGFKCVNICVILRKKKTGIFPITAIFSAAQETVRDKTIVNMQCLRFRGFVLRMGA